MIMKVSIPFLLLIGLFPLFAQDHTENLAGPYDNVQQITEECLMCHEDAGDALLQSNHWNWLSSNLEVPEKIVSGEVNHIPVNNFCLAIPGKEKDCTTCHLPFSGLRCQTIYKFLKINHS